MTRRAALALACGLAVVPGAVRAGAVEADPVAEAVTLSSNRDFMRGDARLAPITCHDGDIQPYRGRTMADVFGAAWPELPAATQPDRTLAPRRLSAGRLTPPRGLESRRATVVVATLVGIDGRPRDAQAICMTAPGFETATERAARSARFEPAKVDGAAVPAVAVTVYRFEPSARSVREGTAD